MVRTKADGSAVAVKVIASSRKAQAASYNAGGSSSSPSEAKRKHILAGNSYCPQDTPTWQKPITSLFKTAPREVDPKEPTLDEDKENQRTSPIRNQISSDSETESPVKKKGKGKAPVGKKAVVKKSIVIESDEDE